MIDEPEIDVELLEEDALDGDEYPDADVPASQQRGPGRPPSTEKAIALRDFEAVAPRRAKLEMQRQRVIDLIRESPKPLTLMQIVREVGIQSGSVTHVFSDSRFIKGGRGKPVRLDMAALERHSMQLCSNRESALKNAAQMVYAELATFGPRTLDQLVAELKFDRTLIALALQSEKFETIGDRWRVRRKEIKKNGFCK